MPQNTQENHFCLLFFTMCFSLNTPTRPIPSSSCNVRGYVCILSIHCEISYRGASLCFGPDCPPMEPWPWRGALVCPGVEPQKQGGVLDWTGELSIKPILPTISSPPPSVPGNSRRHWSLPLLPGTDPPAFCQGLVPP